MKNWNRSQSSGNGHHSHYHSCNQRSSSHDIGTVTPSSYGVPIPPPLLTEATSIAYSASMSTNPIPPPRNSSSVATQSCTQNRHGRNGKRSRHTTTNSSQSQHQLYTRGGGINNYPGYNTQNSCVNNNKYVLGYNYVPQKAQQPHCHYTTKYGEDCSFSKHTTYHSDKEGYGSKTWPKQYLLEDDRKVQTQDDQKVRYIESQQMHQEEVKYAQIQKRRQKETISDGLRQVEKAVLEQRSACRSGIMADGNIGANHTTTIISQEIVKPQQQDDVVKCSKDLAAAAAAHTVKSHSTDQAAAPPPLPAQRISNTNTEAKISTFGHPLTQAGVQLQEEHIQYVDGNVCQVAVGVGRQSDESTGNNVGQRQNTVDKQVSKKPKKSDAYSAYSTLERNMAKDNQCSEAGLGTIDRRSVSGTFRNGYVGMTTAAPSCDTCDAPLTPASLAGVDHRDLETRPLTRSITRATMFDEPLEKTSLFISCSSIYGILLIVLCVAFLTAEVATHNIPLHYFEGLFTYMYIIGILFFLYLFCYVLHECGGCRGASGRKSVNSGGTINARSSYFQNLPRDAIESPLREKLSSLKRPKKYKTSENENSHGSFFLRIGGIGKTAICTYLRFGLGTMIYNGVELGRFFEIPWNSPCYQVLRGINPILQMVFTFSQMYFVFMNARLNIHKFKCIARFGLIHIVATNISVWIRTLVKECHGDLSKYGVATGSAVSEDYMIMQGYNNLRKKFGDNSFWVNGPYQALMRSIGAGLFKDGDNGKTVGGLFSLISNLFSIPPEEQPKAHPLLTVSPQPLPSSPPQTPVGIWHLASNFTCGRIYVMGDIADFVVPYLYPFIIQYSIIAAAILFVMWNHIGKNVRYCGIDDDRISVASRKMTNYAKTDCIGASKGLFFGLLTLVCGLICLILFFVLINHENQQVSQLAIFLADSSHVAIQIMSILAILLGFIRIQKMKFHGEHQSCLNDYLLRISACGIFTYSAFNSIAGVLSSHKDLKNILLLATGAVSIFQVILQLLFITDTQRRRIHLVNHDGMKPGRQVVTFLLICNLTMWIIYTFEIQKVDDSPIQRFFYGVYAWSIVQRVNLPLCIFFRFLSAVILGEIWKNSYKTKLVD